MDAVGSLAVSGSGDGAVQLLGDVVHHHLVQGDAGVVSAFSGAESIIGVAAGGHEVVGDDGVGGVCVKGLAAHGQDGDAVDGVGAGVGGARIVLASVVGCAGVDDELNARYLGEAADRFRGAVGGSFQGLQQFCAGDLNDIQGVAERQDVVDGLLGDVPSGNAGPDAAAVGDGSVNFLVVLSGLPEHSIGNQVTQVGLRSTDILPHTVQVHLREDCPSGETGALPRKKGTCGTARSFFASRAEGARSAYGLL